MMRADGWTDPAKFQRDPTHIEQLLRFRSFGLSSLDDYLQQFETAADEEFSVLRAVVRSSLTCQMGSEHQNAQRMIATFFSDYAISGWNEVIANWVEASLEQLRTVAQPELMHDYVTPLFLSVITRFVGFEDDGSGQLFPMIAVAQRMAEPMLSLGDLRELNAAVIYLSSLLPPLKEAARDEPECLWAYLHRHRENALSELDLRSATLALLLTINTAAQTMGAALYGLLMSDARQWQAATTPGWAECELDRLLSPSSSAPTMVRVASEDAEIGGCPYAAFQPSLSFGAEAYRCPGEFLARHLIVVAIPALARAFPKLLLHKDLTRFRVTPMTQAPILLPCQLDGQSQRLTSRLVEIRDFDTARGLVNDANFSPPQMEPHLKVLATGSRRDLSVAIRIARNALFFMSGDRHAVARRAVAQCLGGNRLAVWQDLIDEKVQQTLGGLEASRSADLVHDFADPLFRGITHPILGINVSDAGRFDTLAPMLQDVLEPWLPMRELLRIQEVFAELLDLMRLPETHRKESGVSLLASMLDSDLPDFDVEDIKALILVLYGASFNLSHTLGNVLHWILTRPPEERLNVADSRWIADNMERLIALCASPKYVYRMARRPGMLGDLDVSIRDTVRLQLPSINRGISHGHLAFGHGLHHCVGAGLSRLMLRRAVPALFQRFPDITLLPQQHKYFNMSQTVAMASLPCRLSIPQ